MLTIKKVFYPQITEIQERVEVIEESGISGVIGSTTEIVNKTYVDSNLATKVNKGGDTMTGPLTLSGNPVDPLHAATKQYVDTSVAQMRTNVTTTLSSKVSKFGDIMYGELVLAGDAVNNFNPVSKRQFDSALQNVVVTATLDW